MGRPCTIRILMFYVQLERIIVSELSSFLMLIGCFVLSQRFVGHLACTTP
jgi:hypothetical protein